jgi:translocation and assembly module TamB
VNQVLLKKGPYQASAYGMIPVAALSPEGRQQGNNVEQMNLNVKLDKANLSILPLLTKEVTAAEGATQGEITITGTLDQPILKGNITIQNGILKLSALKDPIQKVGVDIAFEGDTINIKQFQGYMGTGSYRATGTAKLKGVGLTDYNISLVLDKPMIRSKYFTGTVDGNLMLTQGPINPKLAGKLLFENDIIDIPTIPDLQPSTMNMDLDVDFQIGKKVRFYNPYLYDILAAGRVKLGGSTMEPDISGHIVAIRGTVSYLRTPFKIEEASVEFRQFAGSFEPVIKLKAQTSLQQTVVNLNINGPIGAMEFKLTSEPAMNQQEILSLLTLRSRYFDKQNNGNNSLGRDELVGALDAGLQMRFISGIEGNLRDALGLDEFSFVRDTNSTIIKKTNSSKNENSTINQEVYNLVMSKYVTDKLMVSYTVGVDHDKSELAFRYGLNRRISLTGSIDDANQTWLGAEARFRF